MSDLFDTSALYEKYCKGEEECFSNQFKAAKVIRTFKKIIKKAYII